jgi:hypothetical protein
MFRRKNPENAVLEDTIRSLYIFMQETEVDTKEYLRMVDQMIKLNQLSENHNPKPVSNDTLILVTGNLLGIVLILSYENARVITSKAIGFVLKSVR